MFDSLKDSNVEKDFLIPVKAVEMMFRVWTITLRPRIVILKQRTKQGCELVWRGG
jgi:hypothetical protein